MKIKEALERFTDYCTWMEEGKKPHIEASQKYGLSVEGFFDEIFEFANLVDSKVDEMTGAIEADGFDIEGLKKQEGDENVS